MNKRQPTLPNGGEIEQHYRFRKVLTLLLHLAKPGEINKLQVWKQWVQILIPHHTQLEQSYFGLIPCSQRDSRIVEVGGLIQILIVSIPMLILDQYSINTNAIGL